MKTIIIKAVCSKDAEDPANAVAEWMLGVSRLPDPPFACEQLLLRGICRFETGGGAKTSQQVNSPGAEKSIEYLTCQSLMGDIGFGETNSEIAPNTNNASECAVQSHWRTESITIFSPPFQTALRSQCLANPPLPKTRKEHERRFKPRADLQAQLDQRTNAYYCD